ncbi:hypothetical protein [Asanoa iriomotensis]|nr:hypothetical protein [Asanoa iriomotensis]
MNSQYENPAKPILIPLIAGQAHTMPATAVDLIARWIAKTVLMRALVDRTPTALIPVAEYRRFRVEGTPSARCWIYIGALDESAAGQHLPVGPQPGTPPAKSGGTRGTWLAYTATLVIGRLAAQYVHSFDGARYIPAAERAGLVGAIWPPTNRALAWPPPATITVENARLLDLMTARPETG